MKKILLFVCLFCLVRIAIGQESTPPPSSFTTELLPNNPDVANLGKFGDIPINQYNGTANITVPIYNLNFDGLSIPISANYNTSGIRVAQEASWIGLGWSLNEGYSITREIQGFEDLNSGVTNSNKGWIYTPKYFYLHLYPIYDTRILPENLVQLTSAFSGIPHDTEPDLFTVNLPNSSVSFYLPKIQGDETILTADIVNQKNYKVTYNINTQNFEVTDSSGFHYIFNVKERSTGFTNSDAPNVTTEEAALGGVPNWSIRQSTQVIITWKLSTIISPLGKELTFNFEDGFHCSYPQFSERSHVPVQNQQFEYEVIGNIPSGTLSVSMTTFQNKYLKKIEGDFGSIEFVNSTREDLFSRESFNLLPGGLYWNPLPGTSSNTKKLDAVVVKDYHSKITHRADFSYSYFNEDEGNSDLNTAEKQQYIRLKLDGINVSGKNYRFEYISPNELAPKDSKSTDFWGFYNGVNNTRRTPSVNRYYMANVNSFQPNNRWVFYKGIGAIKKSDIHYGKIGLLKKVIYPTDGSTEFIYEGNSVSLRQPFHTRSTSYDSYHSRNIINTTSLKSSVSYNFRYQYLKLANDPSYSFYNSVKNSISDFPTIYEEFEVGGARIQQIINKEFSGDVLSINQYEYDQVQEDGSLLSSGKLMDDLVFTSSGRGNYEYTPEIFVSESGAYTSANGNYLHSNNMVRTKNSASGSHVGYSKVTHKKLSNLNVSLGKTISLFSNNTNKYLKRNIGTAYQLYSRNGSCPLWVPGTEEYYENVYDNPSFFECFQRRSFYYEDVYIVGGTVFSYDFSNGSLIKTKILDQNDDLLQETENIYTTTAFPLPFHNYPKLIYYSNGSGYLFNPNSLFETVDFQSISSTRVHKIKESIQKNILDGNTMVDTTEYFYGNHLMLEKTTKTNSLNETFISETFYPQDVDANEPYIDELISQNRFTMPIIQKQSKEVGNQNENISKSKTIYGSFENGHILPSKIQIAKGNETLEDKFIYHKYDSKGNPKEVSKKDGTKVYYVWGYKKTQPIIKIEGFTTLTTSQESAITNAINASNDDRNEESENNLRSKLELVRSSFSNSNVLVTTLTYNPLVGITSVTGPRGKTVYYKYDEFNRLEFVKDHEENILSKNQYNYKN
jgi:hypothetical protein